MSSKTDAVALNHAGGVTLEVVPPDDFAALVSATSAGLHDFLRMGGDASDRAIRDAVRGVVAGAIVHARSAGLDIEDIERAVADGRRLGREAIALRKGGQA